MAALAGEDLYGGDLAVVDLGHPGDGHADGGGDLFWPRPGCLRVWVSWRPRAWASVRLAPASICSGETPATCSSRSRSSQSRECVASVLVRHRAAGRGTVLWPGDVAWIPEIPPYC